MLYGIIAVVEPDASLQPMTYWIAFDRRLRAAPDADSGKTVEYALTSRTLLFQPMILPDGVLPNGRSMAGDEASLEVTPRGKHARRSSPDNIYSI